MRVKRGSTGGIDHVPWFSDRLSARVGADWRFGAA
ncbi:hypothetical protein GZL_02741 [Streptomyces sp. 769]|nr:hypothetical protein GZL_02741 [Streptomyces sp. 769]